MPSDNRHNAALLAVEDLVVEFALDRQRKIHAVSGVSFAIARGEALGLVGESGCGKSTVARAVVGLQPVTGGRIWYAGQDLARCDGPRLRALRPQLQMIFQDAAASLNPGRSAGASVAEPLRVLGGISRAARWHRAREMLTTVGLDPDQAFHRRPFEFSGGQCQRISIARALILNPRLLICDEPVSSLDVSVQAQILNLLSDIRRRHDLSMLFISHDLAVVKNVCDRVAVMYLGKLCEIAEAEALYRTPRHPYTQALLAAVPNPDPSRPPARTGLRTEEIPSPARPPTGCRFHTRCPRAADPCMTREPAMRPMGAGRQVACHFPLADIDPGQAVSGNSVGPGRPGRFLHTGASRPAQRR